MAGMQAATDQLRQACKRAERDWGGTQDIWNDKQRDKMEARIILPILSDTSRMVTEMNAISTIISQLLRDL